jgi:hypothetical protein
MSDSQTVKPEEAFTAFISLALRKQKTGVFLSEYWLARYCTNEITEQQRSQIETALAVSDDLFTQWLEIKQAIAVTNVAHTFVKQPEKASTLIDVVKNWLVRSSAGMKAGISSAVAAGLVGVVVMLQPSTPFDDSYVITAQYLSFPYSKNDTRVKSFGKKVNKWPIHFYSGINSSIKSHVINVEEWSVSNSLIEPDCNIGDCSALELRQFHAGKLIFKSYLLCRMQEDGNKPAELIEVEKKLARYAASFWWKIEQKNFKEKIDVCLSSDVVMRSIFTRRNTPN